MFVWRMSFSVFSGAHLQNRSWKLASDSAERSLPIAVAARELCNTLRKQELPTLWARAPGGEDVAVGVVNDGGIVSSVT